MPRLTPAPTSAAAPTPIATKPAIRRPTGSFGGGVPGGLGEWRGRLTRGRWKLYCTLPGHAKLGMHAIITVR